MLLLRSNGPLPLRLSALTRTAQLEAIQFWTSDKLECEHNGSERPLAIGARHLPLVQQVGRPLGRPTSSLQIASKLITTRQQYNSCPLRNNNNNNNHSQRPLSLCCCCCLFYSPPLIGLVCRQQQTASANSKMAASSIGWPRPLPVCVAIARGS